jgi:hypothetical protein
MFKQAKDLIIFKIAILNVKCGLNGKDWNLVKELINKCNVNKIDITVLYL